MIKSSLARLQCHKGFLYTSGLELVIVLTNSYMISHLLGNVSCLVLVCTVIARSLMWVKLPCSPSVILHGHVMNLHFHDTWLCSCLPWDHSHAAARCAGACHGRVGVCHTLPYV